MGGVLSAGPVESGLQQAGQFLWPANPAPGQMSPLQRLGYATAGPQGLQNAMQDYWTQLQQQGPAGTAMQWGMGISGGGGEGGEGALSEYEHAVKSRPDDSFMDRYLAGTLKKHKYPDEVDFPLYHATDAELKAGDLVEPGHPGHFVRRMKHVYAAEQPPENQYGKNVYEVRPTGPIGHRADARAEQGYWASIWPYQVIRKR